MTSGATVGRIQFCYSGQCPSKANFRWNSKDGRRRWKRIKAFEEAIGFKAIQAASAPKLRETLGKRVSVEIVAVNQRTDPDNCAKSILDGLEGVMFADDKDVAVSIRPGRDEGDAYVQITVMWEEA